MLIAVTGASGFIGSHICDELESRGHSAIKLIRPDLDNLKTLASKVSEAEAMVHCAWSGHPRNEVESQRNIYTSLTVAKASMLAGIKHMVFMSSGGGLNGTTAYANSKKEVESLLSEDFGLFDFNLTILRPTAVYGPGQDLSKGLGAVSTFLNAVMNEEPIHILGSPYSGRDFLHVEDLARCVVDVVDRKSYGTFEVGGPEVVQLYKLISIIEETLKKKARVQVENPTGVDPQIVKLDNSKITQATGWIPIRTVENSILEMIGR